jgi:hypothetical protein
VYLPEFGHGRLCWLVPTIPKLNDLTLQQAC